jgi:OOP family OmpA-OmpF porin
MRAIIIIGLLLAADKGFSQEPNLVPNGGFEEYYECPTQISPPFVPSEVDKLLHWYNPTTGTPDYFNLCANEMNPYVGIPAMDCNVNMTNSGDGMIGLIVYSRSGNGREYVSNKLKETLIYGCTYRVKMHISKSCNVAPAIKSIGMHFSSQPVYSDTGSFPLLPVAPQIIGPGIEFMQESGLWYNFDALYVASGAESFLTIGNFSTDEDTDVINDTSIISGIAYYFIDDVSVRRIELPNGVKDSEMYGFDIYPNPATTTVAISHNSNRRINTVAINDLSGRDLQSHGGAVREIDVSGLNIGVYMVRAQFENGAVAVRKLVVQRE